MSTFNRISFLAVPRYECSERKTESFVSLFFFSLPSVHLFVCLFGLPINILSLEITSEIHGFYIIVYVVLFVCHFFPVVRLFASLSIHSCNFTNHFYIL